VNIHHVHKSGGFASRFFVFIFLTLFIAACSEPRLGTDIQPGSDESFLLRETGLKLELITEREDSVRTDELSANLLGCYNDPELGKMNASVYCQLRPAVSNIDFGSNPIADSIVLVLPYRGYYGDITKLKGLQQFTAYRLLEPMYKDSIYFSSDTLLRELSPLGQTPFIAPALIDSVTVGGFKEEPQLRILLNSALGAEFLSNQTLLANAESFVAFFNGLYISANTRNNQPKEGAILDFNLVGGARIDLYYRNDSNDSLKTSFVVNENSARFTRFNHTYSPEVLAAINNPIAGNNLGYVQTMAGLRLKMSITNLDTWKNNRSILVHKAQLKLKIKSGSNAFYAANPLLNCVLKDAQGNLILSPDLLVNSATYSGGDFNESSGIYTLNLARYLQSKLNGIITDDYFYIQPTATGISSYRALINGIENSEGPITFEVLYQVVPD
jgi:hypothetical protein